MLTTRRSLEFENGEIRIGDFQTEHGETINNVTIAYERVGCVGAPILLICHALTGNQHAVGSLKNPGWWSGLIGPGNNIDTEKWQVITLNVLGGCNGSTGPTSNNGDGQKYGSSFPSITIRDIVRSHYIALKSLGIHEVHSIIGGSLGGMQVLEWGILYPNFAPLLIPLATSPYVSDYSIAFNTIARYAITSDPNWVDGNYSENPRNGMGIARMIGMISYRSAGQFNTRFQRKKCDIGGESSKDSTYQIESYLKYQGEKFINRFDANSYLYLLKAMDHHDIGFNRGGWREAVELFQSKIVAFSFEDDLLYPANLLEELVTLYQARNGVASHYVIPTAFGHDGFLVEFEKWGKILEQELCSVRQKER
ncbi:homoserine O-acetyltransferase [Bacillus salitolerans]|uniref:Homoserine O-acetyltransferase n=1 Tax=Bacillus salitolerans TaxID=1437434 RepID=A0ABW4LTB1_9BACI